MIKNKRDGYIFMVYIFLILIIYLYLPFPLISHFMSVPVLEEQIGGGILSEMYIMFYGWWIPELPESNVYKDLFLDHVEQVCLEYPTHCTE